MKGFAETLIDAINRERTRQGYTLKGLSAKAGLGPSTIAKWVSFHASPTMSALEPVLDVLGLELVVRRKKDGTV